MTATMAAGSSATCSWSRSERWHRRPLLAHRLHAIRSRCWPSAFRWTRPTLAR